MQMRRGRDLFRGSAGISTTLLYLHTDSPSSFVFFDLRGRISDRTRAQRLTQIHRSLCPSPQRPCRPFGSPRSLSLGDRFREHNQPCSLSLAVYMTFPSMLHTNTLRGLRILHATAQRISILPRCAPVLHPSSPRVPSPVHFPDSLSLTHVPFHHD